MGKALIVLGVVLVVIGALFVVGDRIPLLGKLPGDIRIERENTTFYFPLTTCILLSVALTLLINLVGRLFGRG
jgi:hypothetical protein